MEFRLIYQGPLKSSGTAEHKHAIRKVFHPQVKQIWDQEPLDLLKGKFLHPNLTNLGDFHFGCLISEKLGNRCELDITLLRPMERGRIIQFGDIDNSLKTLFDALRCPSQDQEIPKGVAPTADEKIFHCLIADDSLITSVKVTCDRLLKFDDKSHVFLLIHVRTKPSMQTPVAMSFPLPF